MCYNVLAEMEISTSIYGTFLLDPTVCITLFFDSLSSPIFTDTRSPRTPEDSGEKLTMLSVNGQRSEVKKPRPQTERLTSIEEKQGEGAARL